MSEYADQPSRATSETRIIPPIPVREIARRAVRVLDHAIAQLRSAGIRIGEGSRLHQAREVLVSAIDTGAIIEAHRRDVHGLRALELAFDYDAIAHTLPTRTNASYWRELRDSLIGELDPPPSNRQAVQLQAQAVVRAAFVAAGLHPGFPRLQSRRRRKSPDLVFQNGATQYAVEVKRPQESKNALPRFREARDQLESYGCSGGILVDVSDCVRDVPPIELSARVRELTIQLYREVTVAGFGQKGEYRHVVVAGCFARAAWRTEDFERSAMVQVHGSSTTGIFARAPNTLQDIRARWLRSGFQNGLQALGQRLELLLGKGIAQ